MYNPFPLPPLFLLFQTSTLLLFWCSHSWLRPSYTLKKNKPPCLFGQRGRTKRMSRKKKRNSRLVCPSESAKWTADEAGKTDTNIQAPYQALNRKNKAACVVITDRWVTSRSVLGSSQKCGECLQGRGGVCPPSESHLWIWRGVM